MNWAMRRARAASGTWTATASVQEPPGRPAPETLEPERPAPIAPRAAGRPGRFPRRRTRAPRRAQVTRASHPKGGRQAGHMLSSRAGRTSGVAATARQQKRDLLLVAV